MIKVELMQQADGTTRLIFETNNKSEEGLAELDEIYSAILGSGQKYGGYINSFSFNVDIKHDE